MRNLASQRRPNRHRALATLLLLAGVITQTGLAAPGHEGPPAGVDWFSGNLSEAFTAAQQQHKPVFVYFGAVWCPPCLELKATVFHRKDFLERLKLFVPVYIDGDAPDAQQSMAQLRAFAYPTVLILRGDHSEIDRVTGGMNLDRYAQVLEAGAGATRPLTDILATLAGNTRPLSLDDCRELAWNDWQLDEAWSDADAHPGWLERTVDQLSAAAERCPPAARIERGRLWLMATYGRSALEAEAVKTGKPGSRPLLADLQHAREVLQDGHLTAELSDTLLVMPPEFLLMLNKLDPEHAADMRARIDAAMKSLSDDVHYSPAMRLYALNQRIETARSVDAHAPVAPELAKEARTRIETALRSVPDGQEHAGIVNAAVNLLDALGDKDRIYALLQDEIAHSATPYYYMSDLAEFEEEQGNKQAAVKWFAQAWQNARGPATRLQWGSRYVKSLIVLEPADEAQIRAAVIGVLHEARATDSFYGRNRKALNGIADRVHTWNKDGSHHETVAEIQSTLNQTCRDEKLTTESRAACREVLAKI